MEMELSDNDGKRHSEKERTLFVGSRYRNRFVARVSTISGAKRGVLYRLHVW